jgi:hypothetical protein
VVMMVVVVVVMAAAEVVKGADGRVKRLENDQEQEREVMEMDSFNGSAGHRAKFIDFTSRSDQGRNLALGQGRISRAGLVLHVFCDSSGGRTPRPSK